MDPIVPQAHAVRLAAPFELFDPATLIQIPSPFRSPRLPAMGPPRALVIHTAETSHERPGVARNVAAWFSNPVAKVSAHLVVDGAEAIQCVPFTAIAWHAGPANNWSLGLELAGKADQTGDQWYDAESIRILRRAAAVCGWLCNEFAIDVRWLLDDEIKRMSTDRSLSGMCGHVDVTRAIGGTHYDPGPNFPHLDFMLAVRAYRKAYDA